MYIEFKTGTHAMVVKGEGGAISVQGGVTNCVANVLWHKITVRVKQKGPKYCIAHFNIKLYRTQ